MFLPFPTKCWKNNDELRYARIWKCDHWSYFGNEETSGSEEVFDQAFQDHIKIWKELPNGEKFCKYLSDLSVTMKESMTANVCVKAGLGNPTEVLHQWQNNNERIKHKMDRREAGLCSFVAEMKQLAYSQETEFAVTVWNVDWVQGQKFVLFLLCANRKVVWHERRPEAITCPESLQACDEWNVCSKSTALCTCELQWCPTPNSELHTRT